MVRFTMVRFTMVRFIRIRIYYRSQRLNKHFSSLPKIAQLAIAQLFGNYLVALFVRTFFPTLTSID